MILAAEKRGQAREVLDRPALDQAGQGDTHPQVLVNAGGQAHGREGVAAQVEEVVADAAVGVRGRG